MRVRTALAVTAAVVVASAGAASAAAGDPGLGSAVDVVGATAIAGPLSIAGAGLTVGTSLTQAPGAFGSAITGGVLAVSDLRASTAGWYVTAAYSAPPVALVGATSLGGANVQLTTSNVVPDAVQGGVLASNVSLVTDQSLGTPVTVATTGLNAGSGLTSISTAYKVRIPANVSTLGVYAGTVTYTVSSVR